MIHKFIALVKANIEEETTLKASLQGRNAYNIVISVGPVYENGKEFCGEVLAIGTIDRDCNEKELREIITKVFSYRVVNVRVRKVEFRDKETPKEINEYRKAG
jgi:hypothetical protein